MTRRAFVLAFVFLLVASGVLLFAPKRPSAPSYQGKPLEYWLEDTHFPNGPDDQQRAAAVRAIGTNAIPFLLEMIAAHEPPRWVRKIEDRIRREPRPWSDDLNLKGVEGFRFLSTNAVSAVPRLIEICEHDYSRSSTRSAINSLAQIGKGAQPALPILVRDFSHKDWMVQLDALAAIITIGGKPELVIPAAAGALGDTNASVRWNALAALSVYGSKARPIVPEILKFRGDRTTVGRYPFDYIVDLALWRIAPEMVGKPLEIEMPASFWKEGMTTEAIKADLFGERKVLIAKGARVPVVAQYWNSDPRPHITFYRGDESSNANDALLGKFEVRGATEENDQNISTLFIVVDGKAFVSARDNHSERFLEIRRLPENAERNR